MSDEPQHSAELEVFFDGGCPLCLREINFLKRRDCHRKIKFTDIHAPDFSDQTCGKSHQELMAKMHGRLTDGKWITGVEVFRRLYSAIGFGPLVMLTRLPILSQMMDIGYHVFARNRLRLTGRCSDHSCSVK